MRNSLFQSDWWMDATTNQKWKKIELTRNNSTIAIWPYVERREKFGLKIVTQPSLTQTAGPWIESPSSIIISKRNSYIRNILTELINKLPDFDFFHQKFHYSLQYLLPFLWAGFKLSPCYTYLIDDLTDIDKIWFHTNQSVRTDVRKANNICQINENFSFDDFWRVYKKTWERQGLRCPYPFSLIKSIDDTIQNQNDSARKILFAVDAKDNIHAANYFVSDKECTYYLLGGSDPQYRNSGANSLLVWRGIELASKVSKTFDFEGSMVKQIERKFSAFGAQPKVYFDVRKMSKRYSFFFHINKSIKKLR